MAHQHVGSDLFQARETATVATREKLRWVVRSAERIEAGRACQETLAQGSELHEYILNRGCADVSPRSRGSVTATCGSLCHSFRSLPAAVAQ